MSGRLIAPAASSGAGLSPELAAPPSAEAAASASPDPSPPRAAEEGALPAFAGALSTHLSPAGEVHMVDVSRKPETARRAVATATVRMRPETVEKLARHEAPKGEVLATARIAGIMAAKRTPELIPLCHAIALTRVAVDIEVDVPGARVTVTATAEAYDRTGVEMEAMVAVSVASLTIYDMLKGTDREMVVSEVKLLEKSGGRSGHFRREDTRP